MPIALITGAGKRIGASLALNLAREGWFVWVHVHRSQNCGEEVVDRCRAAGGGGALCVADLSDPGACSRLIPYCSAQSGAPPDLLVNNASLFEYDHPLSVDVERWDRHHAVNTRAPALLARSFAEEIASAERKGVIVNLLDSKLEAPNADYFSYTVSKEGAAMVTRLLAMALAPRVRVNAIAPGITLPNPWHDEARFQRLHNRNPLGRGCSVEDIFLTLQFILNNPVLTGQVIALDGGHRLLQWPRDVIFASGDKN